MRAVFKTRSGAGVAAEIDIFIQVETEGVLHFGIRPVTKAQDLEPARQGFRQPTLEEERGRTEQDDL